MIDFKNILFVSLDTENNTEALKQAVSLARNNQAALKVLQIIPAFTKELSEHQAKYEAYALEEINNQVSKTLSDIKIAENQLEISIDIHYKKGGQVATDVISYAIKNGNDLIVKQAGCKKERCRGFKALDMDFLRKSPMPVLLTQPISRPRNDIKVAVAIDPFGEQPVADKLAQRLLKTARNIAESCNGKLNVVSCWRYEFEDHVSNNIWFKLPKDEVLNLVEKERLNHEDKLKHLVPDLDTSNNIVLHLIKGRAEEEIPKFVQDNSIDILVMGTVARTGIPGFLIGNTAENIIQQLDCSLLAIKPHGFISPIT